MSLPVDRARAGVARQFVGTGRTPVRSFLSSGRIVREFALPASTIENPPLGRARDSLSTDRRLSRTPISTIMDRAGYAMTQELTIIFEQGESGWWIATIPEVPGAFSQGKTREEARENVLDALNELMTARRDIALRERSAGAELESLPISATAR